MDVALETMTADDDGEWLKKNISDELIQSVKGKKMWLIMRGADSYSFVY